MLISPELMVGLGLRKILYREAYFFSAWRKESLKFGLRQIRRSFWHICAPTVKCFFTYSVIRAPLSPKKMVIQNEIRKTVFSPHLDATLPPSGVSSSLHVERQDLSSVFCFFLIPHWLPKKKVNHLILQGFFTPSLPKAASQSIKTQRVADIFGLTAPMDDQTLEALLLVVKIPLNVPKDIFLKWFVLT